MIGVVCIERFGEGRLGALFFWGIRCLAGRDLEFLCRNIRT